MNKWIDELLKAYVRVMITVFMVITTIIFLCGFQTAESEDQENFTEIESVLEGAGSIEAMGTMETVCTYTCEEPKVYPTYRYYSTKELTAYTATGNACADGMYPSAGYSAASNDPNLWHKWVHIEGYGDFYIHDTGGMSTNVIDIYMNTRSECIQFGRKKGVNVYVYD